MRIARQSALACSIRSLRDDTKFQSMKRGPIDAPPVHAHMAVHDKLASGRDRRRPNQAKYNVVETSLEHGETRAATLDVLTRRLTEIAAQLRLRHAIVKAHLLLFFELAATIAEQTGVRTLDALHLGAARRLGATIGFLTFDVRQAVAARVLGFSVLGV